MSDRAYEPFAHLTAPHAEVYRAVMRTFAAAKRRFVVHLRPEDVRDALVQEDALPEQRDLTAIADALRQLVEWGNLREHPDTSRVSTVEDFHRARFLYQMTERGEAVEHALMTYDEQLGRRGALQAVALADIATELRDLHQLACTSDPDPQRVSLLLRGLVDRGRDLAANAQAFMGSLERTIDLYDADVESFRAYKDRLVEYLERFIKDLVTLGGEIAGLLVALERDDVVHLLHVAARRDAEDAAPDLAPAADGAPGRDPREIAYEVALRDWFERWQGLYQWFVGEPHRPSQSKLLRARARGAIPQLLQVVATLNERRAGRSDRSADFRTLARWFAEAPDDAAMHRLWRVAFGVHASRHLAIDGDTLDVRREDPVPASTSWVQAPPLRISPQLRRTGSYERRGRPNRVIDRAQDRQRLRHLAARELAETMAARARLAAGGSLRLTELGELDPAEFSLFLALLGEALAAWRPGQRQVTVTTADGTAQISMTALDGDAVAEIRTPAGVLRGPDHVIEITDLVPGGGELGGGEEDLAA
jgi:uncharacterized protein (TIGR02677 family)